MTSKEIARRFLAFNDASPSPFHAVKTCVDRLVGAGFVELNEREDWACVPGGKYFFTRNQTSVVAWTVGNKFVPGNGFSIIGAHTDSPCLRVKPNSKITKEGMQQVGVETYGGGIWATWFDRDLTVAGRCIVRDGERLVKRLVHIARPIMRVPTICIHLNRTYNSEGFKINPEDHVVPILASQIKAQLSQPEPKDATAQPAAKRPRTADMADKHHTGLIAALAAELDVDASAIVDFELYVADTQPGALVGLEEEFVAAPRLDNLLSTFVGVDALIDGVAAGAPDSSEVHMVCSFDHEEIGSRSAQGANSAFLEQTLRRLSRGGNFEHAMSKSFLVSADMAHAVHPNYAGKHETNHKPAIHAGVVIKHNANQKYATNAITATLLRECARMEDVPIQEFCVRNDSPCGSTIGPILAGALGMRTVDVGAPQLSMHSIREMCGVDDVLYYKELFAAFFKHYSKVDAQLQGE